MYSTMDKPKKPLVLQRLVFQLTAILKIKYISHVSQFCVFGFKLKVYPIKIPSYTSEHSLYLASYLYVSLLINITKNLFQTPEAALEATKHYSSQLGFVMFL